MDPTAPTVYAMYLRKSEMDVKWQQKNPDGEDPLARHERKLRRLAKASNGVVGEVFADPDKSASKEDVYRPDFERLLVELPRFGGLLAMDIDRVTRNSPKMEALIKVFEANPHLKFLVPDPERNPDLSTPEGRNRARKLVIDANEEALQIARRMREMHEDLREQARPHTGVPGFGTTKDNKADPKQAKLIEAAARDVLAGVNTNKIARDWNKAGVTTVRGKRWTGGQVARMLESPRMAGYRVSDGKRYRLEETGEWARCGPVLIDEPTWEAVCVELERRAKESERQRSELHYLLSGFATCGVCTGPMTGNIWGVGKRGSATEPKYSYKCSAGCLSIAGHQLDGYIEKLLLARWASAPTLDVEPEVFAGTAERERLEALNTKLMAKVNDDIMSIEDAMPSVVKNRKKIDAIKAEERALAKRRARRAAASTNPIEEWHRLGAAEDYERLLLMVRGEIAHLVIQPRGRQGRQWDESRVSIVWAD